MLEDLLNKAEAQAVASTDGHLTLYRFTTGWKAFWGTPDIFAEDSKKVFAASTFSTAEDAIRALIGRSPADDGGDPLL